MTVSVCIPTYNQAAYLKECIQSVLAQTRKPDEIIISDDCSTDNTREVIEAFSHQHYSIKIIYQPVNLGLTANSNACLKAATGELVVRLSSDDLILPDYIKTLSALLEKFPDAGYAHAAVHLINKDGKHTGHRQLFRKNIFEESDAALKAALKGFKVAANILMFRKTALEKVGYINSAYNFGEDFYLAVELAAAGYGNVYSSAILASYRIWDDKNSIRQKRKLEEINGIKSVFDNALMPAFIYRAWNINKIKKTKENFAIAQADCLSWKIFTGKEKTVLKQALLKLSSSFKSRFTFKLYNSAFSFIPHYYKVFKHKLKNSFKPMLTKTLGL